LLGVVLVIGYVKSMIVNEDCTKVNDKLNSINCGWTKNKDSGGLRS